jgi:soluble lytic murein transglycosylase
MKIFGTLLALIACCAVGWIWAPVTRPPESKWLVATGVSEVLPHDFEAIDGVLVRRAPGLGLVLRKQLAIAIAEEASRAGYDPLLVLALIDVESDFQEEAVSPVGAKGLMQIRPTTLSFLAQKEGIRLSREEIAKDPTLCVRLGIRYLRTLHNQFGNLDLALMGYNMGPNKLRSQLKLKDLERFRGYPKAVQREYLTLRQGHGLGGDWTLAARTPVEQ